jgi:hypothetical protein
MVMEVVMRPKSFRSHQVETHMRRRLKEGPQPALQRPEMRVLDKGDQGLTMQERRSGAVAFQPER